MLDKISYAFSRIFQLIYVCISVSMALKGYGGSAFFFFMLFLITAAAQYLESHPEIKNIHFTIKTVKTKIVDDDS